MKQMALFFYLDFFLWPWPKKKGTIRVNEIEGLFEERSQKRRDSGTLSGFQKKKGKNSKARDRIGS